jgi:surface polysaccharide O-acyltransferase-like enzyme
MVAVIVLHVSAEKWYEFDGRSLAWNLVNGCNGMVRWGVPVFIMISGALFLQRDVQIGTLYKKNILRLLVAYLVWRVFYIVAEPMVWLLVTRSPGVFFRYAREKMAGTPRHMWFIPMIIGLYMCVPILREIVRKRKVAAYFLGLSFGVTFLLPQLKLMAGDFVGGTVGKVIGTLCGFVTEKMDISLVFGFSFYFVLGHFLNETELSRKQRRIVYALGVLGFAATVGLNAIVAWKTNIPCETYYGNYRVNVLLEAVAVHTWFKYRTYGNEKADRIIFALAKYSFGAYLIHVFVIRVLMMTGLERLMYTPALGVPVVAVLTVTLSFAASWVIHRIPVLNKWIV